ncbi:MAG: Gfo/Idh/MocA family oxidoreductase [Lentisphaerota bacterium]
MRRSPNVAVVGCGYWGPNLIRNYYSMPECKLQAICDKDESRLEKMHMLYPDVALERDYDHLLEDKNLDAVVVAVPVSYHYDLARKSLLAGKHTFIEKPMAATSAQCEELIEIASVNGLVLMVGHTFLYSPAVRLIKEIVDSGEIGAIRYISARRLNLGLYQKDINVVWDLAPHDLSIILHFMEQAPAELNCRGKASISPSIHDVSNMSLLFKDGGFATIHNSWLDPKKMRDMAIVGDKKMIAYDDMEPLQKIKIYDMRVEHHLPDEKPENARVSYHTGGMHAPYISQEEPLKIEARHFLDCIVNQKNPLTCGARGLELVRILEAATLSLQEFGARVKIPETFPICCSSCWKRAGGCAHT